MLIDFLFPLLRYLPLPWIIGVAVYIAAIHYFLPFGSDLLYYGPPAIALVLRVMMGMRVPWTKWGKKQKLRALIRKREEEGNESLDYAERELLLKLQGLVGDEVDGPEY